MVGSAGPQQGLRREAKVAREIYFFALAYG
jgi:hypothetical protein